VVNELAKLRKFVRIMPFRLKNFLICCGFSLLAATAVKAQVKFIPNAGQWPDSVLYRANLNGGKLWVMPDGLLFQLYDAQAPGHMHDHMHEGDSIQMHAFRLRFQGAEMQVNTRAEQASAEIYNYFTGNNPQRWASGLKAYGKIWLDNIYKGVHLEIFSDGDALKYNLHVAAGVNPDIIRFQYEGVTQPFLHKGELVIQTALREIRESIPRVWDPRYGESHAFKTKYIQKGKAFGFDVQRPAGDLGPLVIDPILVFSTYSGSLADNFGCTGTYDDLGNAYAGGTVFDFGFPTSLGAYQPVFGGGEEESRTGYGGSRDMGILKFAPDGRTLLYATYLGGSGNEQPHSLVVDPNGNLVIMGSTRSRDFPTNGTGWDQTHNGDYDIVVAKLNASGTGLLGATYVGGAGLDGVLGDRENLPNANSIPLLYNYADEFRGEVICDNLGFIYVASTTHSFDFPVVSGNFFQGREDAVIMKLSPGLNQMIWSTCMGGTGSEAAYGLAFGLNDDLFVCGGSNSGAFNVGFEAWGGVNRGGMADGFLLKLNARTGAFQKGIFAGTSLYDQCYFVQTDTRGLPYVYGQTEGAWQVTPGTYANANAGQFITRYRADLSGIDRSTTIGSGGNIPNISPSAFLVDQCNRIFLSGWGGNTNTHIPKTTKNRGNTRNMPVTPDAVQRGTDGSDFYVAVLSRNMDELLYATFFGGITTRTAEAEEHVDGGTSRFDKKGIIYQAVCAGCGQNGLFPTTPGAYSRANRSENCNNAIFKIDFENLNRKPVSRDTLYKITATERLNFEIVGTDPDVWDTVYLDVFADSSNWAGVAQPRPMITKQLGAGRSVASVNWATNCNHSRSDTFVLRVRVRDDGCPQQDTTYNTIRIVVEPPPLVEPPTEICLMINETRGEVTLEWPASPTHPYWKHLILYKQTGSSRVVLDTLRNANGGRFTDRNAADPRGRNYCYYIVGVNVCGVVTDRGFRTCTQKELNSPIDSTYLITATVEDNRGVRTFWLQSLEQDFGSYELFRSTRDGKEPYSLIATLTNRSDTTYLDMDVNVQTTSYCYKVRVLDRCGHVSVKSNRGCNIVLAGSATGKPLYYFDLDWQNYDHWPAGISGYTLERRVDTGILRPIVAVNNAVFDYRDNRLNYDWGGYFYRIRAFEAPGGYNATSLSNEFYLFQPPELYVPDAFTPNGDDINDVWGTVPVFVRDYHMMVFNRWGQKVFDSKDKKLQWKGVMGNGKPSDNVFAWLVVYKGWDDRRYTQRGVVHVLE
jgi:gliding motility-associated-like protein